MGRTKMILRAAAAPMALLLMATSPALGAPAAAVSLDIPAGPLGKALASFAAETHQQLLYSAAIVAGRTAPALKGRYTPDEALQILLGGSDIEAEHTGPTVVVLKRRPSPDGRAQKIAAATPQRAREDGGLTAADAPPAPLATSAPPETTAEIIVTGTHIRGVKASASPVVSFNREDMLRNGDATVGDALTRLPQNFGGAQSPVNALNGSDRSGTNTTFAQGVNLRGLGANATLVLVDGRRMAGTGNLADFADVSAIPSAAIDHVEVLLDGASAIYGSDAVGGVVNIITRKAYEGADSTLRFGDAQGGGGGGVQATQAFGTSWPGGHLLLTYEYQHSFRLSASSRRFNADSDLRPLGGTNHDSFDASPGNILGLNATATGYVPIYAIPAGSGVGLKPSDFVAGAVNYQNYWHNTDISPESDRNGVYADLRQDLGPRTTLDLEARYNLRHYSARSIASQSILQVTNRDPYYVSPNGAASELIAYSLDGAAGPQINAGKAQSYDLSLGLKHDIGRTWRLDAYAGLAGEVGHTDSWNVLNSGNMNEALGTTADNPVTSFSTAANGFYNPYGSGASNAAALRAFISNGFSHSTNVNLVNVASVQADGTVIALPGGPLKAAIGVQYRHEHFEPSVFSITNGVTPFQSGGVLYTRDVSAAFAELNIPLVGAANAMPGIQRLELSLAGRVEHYDDVGSSTNPKIGLQWRPIEDVLVRATYGTSFRGPALSELGQPTLYAPTNLTVAGKTTLILLQYGGNATLRPEKATTWTTGVEWTPRAAPGLRLGLNWFDIDFTDEIASPGVQYLSTVLSNPALASLVRRLDPTNPADVAVITALLAKAVGSSATLFPPTAYGAIVDARYVNTASREVRGIDLFGNYSLAWRANQFGVQASATYLDRFAQTQVAGGPSQSLLDTPNQPVNVRGRLGFDWNRGPYQASLNINYVNAYKDPVAQRTIPAWTTCDLSLQWRAPATLGPLQGVAVAFSVQNLFDRDPPFYDNVQAVGYDPANASPFGRAVAVQLSKRW